MLERVITLAKLKSAALHDRNRAWRKERHQDVVAWVKGLVLGGG